MNIFFYINSECSFTKSFECVQRFLCLRTMEMTMLAEVVKIQKRRFLTVLWISNKTQQNAKYKIEKYFRKL